MRTLLIPLAFAASLAAMGAVPENFQVETPKFKRIVKCNAEDGVNIRKSPSATAPRSVYNEAKIENYDVPVQYYTYWSTGKTGGSVYADKFTGTAALVSEADGWYEAFGIGPYKEPSFQNGWVSAKFCSVSEAKPLTPQVLAEHTDFIRPIWGDMLIYYSADVMNEEYTFYIGKLSDGQLVCPYMLEVPAVEETAGKTTFKANDYGVMIMYCNPGERGIEGPELSKLSEATIREILSHAEKRPAPLTVYYDGSYLGTY